MIKRCAQLSELFHRIARDYGDINTALERSRYLHLELHFFVAVFLVFNLFNIGDFVLLVVGGESHQCQRKTAFGFLNLAVVEVDWHLTSDWRWRTRRRWRR